MNDHETLNRMQQSWPETDNYLERVGQVQNDLMVLREVAAREAYESSLTWLDHLAVGVEDLTKRPNAGLVMQMLFRDGVVIRDAMEVPEFRELKEAHDHDQAVDQEDPDFREHLLETPGLQFWESLDEAIWALPEFQKKLTAWADQTAIRHGHSETPVSLAQAAILFNVCQFLEQEPEPSPGWAAECLRSALSSEFFEKAVNRHQ
jgi:hypothetical protein